MVEIGPGDGAITLELLRHDAEVVAVEADGRLVRRLRDRTARLPGSRLRVSNADFLSVPLPSRPFRVVASLPFGETTAILARLLDDPRQRVTRADLIVQWEVARKRSASPPATLRSAAWAPWWQFQLGARIRASDFRPAPRVDAGVLVVTRRDPPLLPVTMAADYAAFVRRSWPFAPQ